ncbi:MAG: 16S rRNA (guanine(966)-N(2))-methyltransferase RsmD [Acidobacteria bacterium]|nr:16S rRNA (guanine(966)-N(2))-methyltransferase RsmD [Acidobacteriota bacterium]
MRIIAGQFKSRRLKSLRGQAMRPTSDRLRETLFNILGPAIQDSVFVDCFAGTGAVGIEALSRGARQVFFVENHRPAVALIGSNLASLGITSGFEILGMDVARGLESLASRKIKADFVFLDPPYADVNVYSQTLKLIDSLPLLASNGLVIVEHTKKQPLPERLSVLHRARVTTQGDSGLSFYKA